MFLKPSQPGGIAPPFVMEGDAGRASVTFIDDAPLISAEGAARFSVASRRRWPLKAKPPVPVDASGPTARQMRKGDTLHLDLDGRQHAWSYDPDGNLGLPMRLLLKGAREGTSVAILAIVLAFGSYVGLQHGMGSFGEPSADNPIPKLVRDNLDKAYPRKEKGPSPYLDAMVQAKREGRDIAQASRDWIAAHPVQDAQKETKP